MNRTRSKSQEKREQILCAATELFTKNGYRETSVSQIAQHADVSKQTVYSHFGNKEELFAEAIRQGCESLFHIDVSVEINKPARVVLLELATSFLQLVTSEQALAVQKICVYEAETYPQLATLFFQSGPRRVHNEVKALLAAFEQAGVLRFDDLGFATWQLLNMFKGEALLRHEFNIKEKLSTQEINRYLESCVDMFISAYTTKQ